MRLIAMNTVDSVAGEIVSKLFTKWREEQGSLSKENETISKNQNTNLH